MNNYQRIKQKLEAFIRKYYTNELLKGGILFFSIGLLYFLLTVSFEYFFWLNSSGRRILFWSFVLVEVGLFARFILYPLAKLFKLSKGISYEEASQIIGQHFPEVNDKLLNILQLHKNSNATESELLLASINQKSAELQPVPFQIAVNFKSNLKYIKYAIIPVLVVLAIYISGNSNLFSESYSRVVNYEQAYEPPAPFYFQLTNQNLKVKENESLQLRILTEGDIIPENASIHFNGETYFLKSESPGVFTYTFERINQPIDFYLSSNQVTSKPYQIEMVNVPALVNFQMELDYPAYLEKQDEVLNGTGNATIPQGTKVTWKLSTKATDQVNMKLPDTLISLQKSESEFSTTQRIYRNTAYELSTSNKALQDYEKLNYQLKVVRDEYPEISVQMKQDSTKSQLRYYYGKIQDDYGLTKLQLVYYPAGETGNMKKLPLSISQGTFDEFIYAFPDGLNLEPGKNYEYYFQVFDNDRVNGSKNSKSETFGYRKFTREEENEEQLNKQEQTIKEMDSSLEKMKESNEELKELDQLQKEKNQLNYNDKKKLENYIKRQKQQEQLMEQYSKQLKENLEEFQPEEQDQFKEQLKERLDQNEKRIEENEKLLEELQKYQDKINKEELNQKIEQLSKQNQNQEKSLEQLLELTKRYYVQKKMEKMANDLQKLGEKQQALSKNDSTNTAEKQKEMNEAFQKLQEEMEELEKENQGLQKPMDMPRDKEKESEVEKDQQEATDELNKEEEDKEEKSNQESGSEQKQDGEQQESGSEQKQDGEQQESQSSSPSQKAKQKQNSAGEKMKQMGGEMMNMMMQGGAQQNQEDAEMLRQILDNLITFSFQQEDLMEDFKSIEENSPNYAKKLRYQNVLKENFQHVDDSLYALALRNPMIGEQITSKLTDIEFNINKSLERLSENQIRTGVASQQYTFKGANDLANMLNQSLSQIQAMAMGSGGGQGQNNKGQGQSGQQPGRGFQLSDIIQKQGELGEQMGKGKGKKPGQEGGEGSQSGKGNQQGEGEGNQSGNSGENGRNGKDGNGSRPGENGKPGQNGLSQEEMSGKVYQIYQQQQELRNQLEDLIQKNGLGKEAKQLARSMQQVEDQLLRQGITRQTESKMRNIQHQLMKLENAALQQGQDNKRESETNKSDFRNTKSSNLETAKDYFNTTEILNRQSLPLQQNYKEKVKEYFKGDD